MRRAVIDLAAGRPAWRFGPKATSAMRRAFGKGWEVTVVTAAADSDGDGGGGSPEAVAAARGAEVYIGWGVPRGVAAAAAGTLQWAHTASVGVGSTVTDAFRATGAILTNGRGVQVEPMAEWVIAAVAACARGFLPAIAAQREARWAKDPFTDGSVRPRELPDLRLGLIGLGGIGAAVARRAAALGMVVRAVRRHPHKRRPRGVRWVGGAGQVGRLASQSDVLVAAAPATAHTRTLVDGPLLDRLPEGAHLVNVARGWLVDEGAIRDRLDAGRLAGYVTDVTRQEPLPADHWMWAHPRVLVTPHVSAVTPHFEQRATAQIVDNIGRYVRGRRLRSVVDLEAGY